MGEADSETRGRPGPAELLTVPGRLLLIACLALGAAGFYFYFIAGYEELPPGSYPVLWWVVPVALAAIAFFVSAAAILERLGVRIYRNRHGRT